MTNSGTVSTDISNGIGTITFFHPKSNALPGELLRGIAGAVKDCGSNDDCKVIVLKSEGEKAFCAGASFDELISITNKEEGKYFFMGFAEIILAIKDCPKLVIARVQGKAVGGGVGVIAAADYALALNSSSVKLSELALGIGPFVVGPAVERKIGTGAFSALSVDTDWRDATWATNHSLYCDTFDSIDELDKAVSSLATKLSKSSPEAMAELKRTCWKDTEHWAQLLEARAAMSGQLILSEYSKKAIEAFKKG